MTRVSHQITLLQVDPIPVNFDHAKIEVDTYNSIQSSSRNNDITFSDRTQQEEAMLLLTSDYIDLVRESIKVAGEHGVKEDIINNLLDQKTRFHGVFQQHCRFLERVEGRFQIDEIVRVNRKNDEHTISNKIFDFSVITIQLLLKHGYNALVAANEYLESKENRQ